jgi:hypothetical protein
MDIYNNKKIFRAFTHINGRTLDINNQVKVTLDIEGSTVEHYSDGAALNYHFNIDSTTVSVKDWHLKRHLESLISKTNRLLSVPNYPRLNIHIDNIEDKGYYIIDSDMEKINSAFNSIDKIGYLIVDPLYIDIDGSGEMGIRFYINFNIIGADEKGDKMINILRTATNGMEDSKKATLSIMSDIVSGEIFKSNPKDFFTDGTQELTSVRNFDNVITNIEFLKSPTGDNVRCPLSLKFIDIDYEV